MATASTEAKLAWPTVERLHDVKERMGEAQEALEILARNYRSLIDWDDRYSRREDVPPLSSEDLAELALLRDQLAGDVREMKDDLRVLGLVFDAAIYLREVV